MKKNKKDRNKFCELCFKYHNCKLCPRNKKCEEEIKKDLEKQVARKNTNK